MRCSCGSENVGLMDIWFDGKPRRCADLHLRCLSCERRFWVKTDLDNVKILVHGVGELMPVMRG